MDNIATIKGKIERIQKIDRFMGDIGKIPVVDLSAFKKLKDEKISLVQGIINQGRRESKT